MLSIALAHQLDRVNALFAARSPSSIYVDSDVEAAYKKFEAEKARLDLPRAVLGHLSQIHRSADGRRAFHQVTGFKIGIKALPALFSAIHASRLNLSEFLNHPALASYGDRAGPDNFG